MSGTVGTNAGRGSGSIGTAASGATVSASDPAIDTNPADGVGTQWVNSTSGEFFVCTDATTDENVWTNVGAGSGDVAPAKWYGGRALYMCGTTQPTRLVTIDYFSLASTGDASDFGDRTVTCVGVVGTASNQTRLVMVGGSTSGGVGTNIEDYVTVATTGDATDFGDLTVARRDIGSSSDASRGIFVSGNNGNGTNYDTMDYVTIASAGDATDFGDLSVSGAATLQNCSNGTRAIWANPGAVATNVIEYSTIATTGDSTDFGDLTVTSSGCAGSTGHSDARAVIATADATIGYVTIATTGDATDFGDLVSARGTQGVGNGTNCTWAGGRVGGSTVDQIDYIPNISSTGDASDFGNLTGVREQAGAGSGGSL